MVTQKMSLFDFFTQLIFTCLFSPKFLPRLHRIRILNIVLFNSEALFFRLIRCKTARNNDVSEAKHFLSHLLFQFSFESKNGKLAITNLGNSEIILQIDFFLL